VILLETISTETSHRTTSVYILLTSVNNIDAPSDVQRKLISENCLLGVAELSFISTINLPEKPSVYGLNVNAVELPTDVSRVASADNTLVSFKVNSFNS